MPHGKLKIKEVALYRQKLLKEQKGLCYLCKKRIKLKDAVLDHDHTTGRCRAVLHRDCNILLGKIENFTKRQGKRIRTEGRLDNALKNVYSYMMIPWGGLGRWLHPTHLTADDKIIRKYKRLIRSSKKPETKQKYQDLLTEFTNAR